MPHVRRQFFPLLLALAPLASFAAEPSSPVNPRFTGTPPLRVWRMDEMGASLFDSRAHEMGTAAVNWRAVVHPGTGFLYVANNEGVFEFDGVCLYVTDVSVHSRIRLSLIATRNTYGARYFSTARPSLTGLTLTSHQRRHTVGSTCFSRPAARRISRNFCR